jgi:transcriptional regulator with XRE-family HTH domain
MEKARKGSFNQVLKSARKALRMTQRQLATQVGVEPSYVAYLENGQRRPSLKLLGRLAEVLALEKNKLFLLAFPEASSLLGSRPRVAPKAAAWQQFANNKALIARHNIQPSELQVLSQANLLGRITEPRYCSFILNAIRQAEGQKITIFKNGERPADSRWGIVKVRPSDHPRADYPDEL